MRLLIDIGNTRLKWAWQTEQQLGPSDAIVYALKNFANELPVLWQDQARPQQVWVASVAKPKVIEALNHFLSSHWGVTAHYIEAPDSALGLSNAYKEPGKLGCDRWAAMLAAYHQEKNCVLMVDCGSAVTIDAIDSRGRHLGGAIAPGLVIGSSALQQQTNLHWQSSNGIVPASIFMDSTADGIAAGLGYSIVGLIELAYHRLMNAGHHPVVYLTGGDAATISSVLTIEHKHCDDLVLQGLAMIADHA